MDEDLRQLNEQIDQCNRDIAAEEQRAENQTSGKREERRRELEEAKERLQAAEEKRSQLASEHRELEQLSTTTRNAGLEEDAKAGDLKKQVVRYQDIIEQCKRKENDKFIPYGNNIKMVLDRIRSIKWAGEAPLGPLGLYVNVKEPEKWGNILRLQLGQYLTAFAITDARDRPVLKRLLAEFGKYVLYSQRPFANLQVH